MSSQDNLNKELACLHLVVEHVRLKTACMANRVQLFLSGTIATLCCQPPVAWKPPAGFAPQVGHLHQAYVPCCSRTLQLPMGVKPGWGNQEGFNR